jgi:hypothetical protein
MRLHEIKLDIPSSEHTVSGTLPSKYYDVLGTGTQTVAYLSKKYPDTVVKTLKIHKENDAALQFLRICLHHMNDFLPVVYYAKKFNSEKIKNRDINNRIPPSERDFTVITVVERLYSIDTISTKELTQLCINYGIVDEQEMLYYGDHAIYSRLENNLSMPRSRKLIIERTKSNDLKIALRLLSPLLNYYGGDLNERNFMLRKYSKGFQLVINDPVVS